MLKWLLNFNGLFEKMPQNYMNSRFNFRFILVAFGKCSVVEKAKLRSFDA
jgi:hypothetical protein